MTVDCLHYNTACVESASQHATRALNAKDHSWALRDKSRDYSCRSCKACTLRKDVFVHSYPASNGTARAFRILCHRETTFWRQMLQLTGSVILEAAFSVADIRGLFVVAVDAILSLLGTFPKWLKRTFPLTVRSEAVPLVRLVSPHGERLLLAKFGLLASPKGPGCNQAKTGPGWGANQRRLSTVHQDFPKKCPAHQCMPTTTLMLLHGPW